MEKLKALFSLFRKGSAVANPAAWKAGQVTGNMVGAVLVALAYVLKAFGYDLPISEDQAVALGTGVVTAFNVVLTIVTSKHVGIPGLQPAGVELPGAVPSPQEGSGSPLPAPQAAPVSRFDESTRQRAEAFLRARNPSDANFEAP